MESILSSTYTDTVRPTSDGNRTWNTYALRHCVKTTPIKAQNPLFYCKCSTHHPEDYHSGEEQTFRVRVYSDQSVRIKKKKDRINQTQKQRRSSHNHKQNSLFPLPSSPLMYIISYFGRHGAPVPSSPSIV